jgi:hypothetical protein
MRLHLTCRYCNNKFEKDFYSRSQVKYIRCTICNDKNLDIKNIDSIEKIDQYKDDPKFTKEEDNDDYDGYL